MLKRIISAMILILIAIPLVIAGEKLFAIAIGVIGLFALKEIIDLKKSHQAVPIFMSFIFYISLLFLIYIIPFEFSNYIYIRSPLLILLFFLYLLPTLHYHHKKIYSTKDAFYFFAITLFIGLACHGMIMIRNYDLKLFLLVVLIPILTDTFALFFGLLIGRHKLAPHISPKKTWEGSICGTFCATICSSGFYYFLIKPTQFGNVILLIFLLSIFGQLGDLFFSTIKRENEIKDYSNLIPEHGGILDRFDSIFFTVLAFLFIILYF